MISPTLPPTSANGTAFQAVAHHGRDARATERLTVAPDPFAVDSIDVGPRPWPAAVPLNGQPLTLAEVVDHEAMGYRAWRTPTGDFLARQMERLAQLIRWTGATTPEDHEARMEVWDEEIREQWFDRGYHEGYEAGRRDACRRG